MPPPTEQGFQHCIVLQDVLEFQSQCPLQQNKGFNMEEEGLLIIVDDGVEPRLEAMRARR